MIELAKCRVRLPCSMPDRREELTANPDLVRKALTLGAEKARASAAETMKAVRKAVGV